MTQEIEEKTETWINYGSAVFCATNSSMTQEIEEKTETQFIASCVYTR